MSNKIRIKFGPIEFEAEGESDIIQREREQFFSLLPQAMTVVSPIVPERTNIIQVNEASEIDDENKAATLPDKSDIKKYESIGSFLKDKSFANNVDLVMGVAYFIDCIEKHGAFTAKDIEDKLSEARYPKPSNTSHFINQNIKKGFIAESPEKKSGRKAFTVLIEGKNWCETYTPPETTTSKKKSPKQSATTKSPLLDIPLDELNLESYCDILSLEKLEDQILVTILIYSKEKNIEYFSFQDIVSVLKDKFKIPVTKRKVQYFFEKSGAKFDKTVNKNKTFHKIMSNGIKEAEEIIAHHKKVNFKPL